MDQVATEAPPAEENSIVDSAADLVNKLVNETFGKTNATTRPPATPEGQAVAYVSLVLMALIPIFFGSFRSVHYQKQQKESGEQPETITRADAAKFPLVASAMLFALFLVFKIFSQEYVNVLIGMYFMVLGVFALDHVAGPYLNKWIPNIFPNANYHLTLIESNVQGSNDPPTNLIDFKFDRKDLVSLCICVGVALWYTFKKHWIANNLFGMAFALNGVELLQLNSIGTGCILLSGLFVYDIFWVFGTNVMVTVAKNFNAPIKVVFPQDFLVSGIYGDQMAMLGLGDIVIPGIFIALLLRFDVSLRRQTKTYFYAGFAAYILGLVATMVVMVIFKHPQPALLYLVPTCLGIPLLTALVKGDLDVMFKYSDNPEEFKEMEKKAN